MLDWNGVNPPIPEESPYFNILGELALVQSDVVPSISFGFCVTILVSLLLFVAQK